MDIVLLHSQKSGWNLLWIFGEVSCWLRETLIGKVRKEWLPRLHFALMWAGKGEKIPTFGFSKKIQRRWKLEAAASGLCQTSNPRTLKWAMGGFLSKMFLCFEYFYLPEVGLWSYSWKKTGSGWYYKNEGRDASAKGRDWMENWKWTIQIWASYRWLRTASLEQGRDVGLNSQQIATVPSETQKYITECCVVSYKVSFPLVF